MYPFIGSTKKMFQQLISLLVFFGAFTSSASSEDPNIYANKSEMSGYKLDQFKNFENTWKLVTVRFRKDTGELRFTYANSLAWKTLSSNNRNYPDGSVFAKIGIATQEDPAFTSSAVPSGARRYQFMVRNAKKHQDTEGWGYALFDKNGKTFPGEPKVASQACAACHHLVPDRASWRRTRRWLAP